MNSKRRVRFDLNGQPVELSCDTDARLIDSLREDLHLTGTKEGCSVGVCGACTVLVDGEIISACLVLTVLVDGREVRTIEGLGESDRLSGLQEAFITHESKISESFAIGVANTRSRKCRYANVKVSMTRLAVSEANAVAASNFPPPRR